MTAVAAEARQPPAALLQALEQLSGPLDQLDATAQLQAVEEVSRRAPLHRCAPAASCEQPAAEVLCDCSGRLVRAMINPFL